MVACLLTDGTAIIPERKEVNIEKCKDLSPEEDLIKKVCQTHSYGALKQWLLRPPFWSLWSKRGVTATKFQPQDS